ncbi:peptidase M15 [Niastella yeongjuensis]|uniref:D-alanyl-D-alanine dipeptidase n=1 Tax=Niastella yeongjuensis TaxID=354355 RepID=A0A1V9EB44_9BACT|nr:M15 family metallopeptidase [Niastella yeongjuensis]OQP43155.1 peptidase M15 [Niastella yeongjuensis]SEO68637.1 D-alanyl-D-alanine dipeptidase [Niastella yeongjuensis]
MLYKIVFKLGIYLMVVSFFFHATTCLAQTTTVSKYGVSLINKPADYQLTVRNDSAKKMVELLKLIPGLVYDLRYATTNNFTHLQLYVPATRFTFLRLPAARALATVQKELNSRGYGLKIFDAYRPYSVTVKFWELILDERYVANPVKGSGHNRGLAVDCTIIDLKSRRELDMGTGFDNFSDTAHHNFTALPAAVLDHRKLLKEVMEKHGFNKLDTEWWHFYWSNDRGYEVLDIPFEELVK